jgi:hypothetical protein
MDPKISKREFLVIGASLAAARAMAQAPAGAGGRGGGVAPIPNKTAKTTKLFKAPGMCPNGLAVAPEGLWVAQQKSATQPPLQPGETRNSDEAAWLVDWNGKLLKTLITHSRNTSGMAYGNGCVWMGANAQPEGIFQVDMNSNELSHRQIPLNIAGNGGGCHGLQWHDGKLWIAALSLGGLLRVDPVTWVPEVLLPVRSDAKPRLHDLTIDDENNIWVVTGTNSTGIADAHAGLSKYDGTTGRLLMTVDLEPGSCDPHGLVYHDGKLVSCDAGIHPGWKDLDSPSSGYIFTIDIL